MISKITLEVDRDFLDGYRAYKIDEVLEDDNVIKVTYSILSEFINKSTYNLNRLYEELHDDVETLVLNLSELTIRRNYNTSALSGLSDLFDID